MDRVNPMTKAPVIETKNLTKIYKIGTVETVALNNISFNIYPGEFVAIMGPSGSGKSTLMHLLGALDLPTSGKYILDGKDISKYKDDKLAFIRNKKIGFIFQSYNLLPRTTALKNVILPMAYGGMPKLERLKKAKQLLTIVGLQDRMEHTSNQLSGGQQQRVAIARGIAMNPKLLLADEPTGNLASIQGKEIMEIFQKLNKEGHTIVMITHEPNIAKYAKRIITIRDGKILSDVIN